MFYLRFISLNDERGSVEHNISCEHYSSRVREDDSHEVIIYNDNTVDLDSSSRWIVKAGDVPENEPPETSFDLCYIMNEKGDTIDSI